MAEPIHPRVRIGHVHLKVADLERSLGFYCGVLGFELTQRFGSEAAFISAGGYHHHIGLNTWESLGGPPPQQRATGLYHLAILYPSRADFAGAFQRLIRAGISLDGAADHGVSEALYLHDPDKNGVELYWDRPSELWPRGSDGQLAMFTRRLDLDRLLETNTLGPLRVTQAFAPLLVKSGAPRIINVSSGGGQLSDGADGWAPGYCISKTALNGVTLQLAAALPKCAVNSVCPGWVRTDMGGAGAPRFVEEGADTFVWLATDAPQTLTGKFFRDRQEIAW